ncbi:guanitoxin biosynthesis heme-dependent pre-guanitoxin N-hydroxylase GntA [Luteimonas sp. MC1750]|uniref:guanitoxin biosynthesis heme-dependent pre-guanitoxin N-hydroxylase GntA n=1 Tax=Luteimonas sp. MC1750 TaxID=2799326 RepID=UPI0018F0FBBC|nr:guanitoxin biosynthesis heme-dependent pre-guanitoxin N-hydroxylase GntA [Luteimonas sp. MC1750]MBJ6984390.1 YqcI/YcgG family protein [Luteimonas sp. MC1750]QQO04991.1 YqcI/YcgG family protein [Luteimonas sp. MC1750]
MNTATLSLPAHPRTGPLTRSFLDHVANPAFPCVGSKAALARDAIETFELGALGDRRNDVPLLDALAEFGAVLDASAEDDLTVRAFVALFDGPGDTSEQRFEALLWSQLQRLHELDVGRGARWSSDVSRDPADPRFSLSLAGHPFFVIGLHAGASRTARRFESPALVFNSHRQFDRLKGDGRYAKMQAATRERDIALQGSINPNLADYGAASEARQYSGRAVGSDWTCPFRPKPAR